MAGGLGVRVAGLTRALAARGFRVHLFFVGDPDKPGRETLGNLELYRWGQWISRHHQQGVYSAELEKKGELERSLPPYIIEHIARPAAKAGKRLVVLAEEWHTADTATTLSDLLYQAGLRDRTIIFWNANHRMGLHRIDFARLGYVATITTVSKFMRQVLWDYGINPLVIPNGIDDEWFEETFSSGEVDQIQSLFSGPLLVKVGRFDPDKRWLMAIEAVAQLKSRGLKPTLVIRGGLEPHGGEVFHRARELGLSVADVVMPGTPTRQEVLSRLAEQRPNADLIHLRLFLPRDFLALLYRAADAVLVNSGFEPFGLVGLEVMASGGMAITGGTGEDYARAFVNGLVVDNDDPRHLADLISYAMNQPGFRDQVVRQAQATAKSYRWQTVLDELIAHIVLAFERQSAGGNG